MSEANFWAKTAKLDQGRRGTTFANDNSTNQSAVYTGLLIVSNERQTKLLNELASQIQLSLFDIGFQCVIKIEKVVSCNSKEIEDTVLLWTKNFGLSMILICGGSGIEACDVTPEVTRGIIDKDVPGITNLITSACMDSEPPDVTFRGICGVKNDVLIVNLPASRTILTFCIKSILPALSACLEIITQIQNLNISSSSTEVSVAPQQNGVIRSGNSPLTSNVSEKEELRMVGNPPPSSSKLNGSEGSRQSLSNRQVARRVRASPYLPATVEEAQTAMKSNVFPLPLVSKYYQEAFQHYLYDDVTANDSVPSQPTVILDGYAVIAADTPGDLDIMSVNSSTDNNYLNLGKAIRVRTGSVLPPGADAVVPIEETFVIEEDKYSDSELVVRMLESKTPGAHIRAVGSDLMKGEVLLKSGTKLGHTEVGLLGAAGVLNVPVHRLPTVAVLSVGNELTEPDKVELRPGESRDTNRITLLLALRKEGYKTVDAGLCSEPLAVRAAITSAYQNADVLLITGCASFGENDNIKSVLMELGATIHYGRVALKPGNPTSFSTLETQRGKKIIFSLAGNPVPALVAYYVLVLPCLRRLSGATTTQLPIIQAKTSTEIFLDKCPEYQRAKIRWDLNGRIPWADVTGRQIISRLMSMVEADVLLILPPRTASFKSILKGQVVNALVIK